MARQGQGTNIPDGQVWHSSQLGHTPETETFIKFAGVKRKVNFMTKIT